MLLLEPAPNPSHTITGTFAFPACGTPSGADVHRYFTVAPRQNRNFAAELADGGGAHSVHRSIVFARIARIRDQPFNRPGLNLNCLGSLR